MEENEVSPLIVLFGVSALAVVTTHIGKPICLTTASPGASRVHYGVSRAVSLFLRSGTP